MSIRRPDGTIIHMPFPGHRTVAAWIKPPRFDCWGCIARSVCPFKTECPYYRERPA